MDTICLKIIILAAQLIFLDVDFAVKAAAIAAKMDLILTVKETVVMSTMMDV